MFENLTAEQRAMLEAFLDSFKTVEKEAPKSNEWTVEEILAREG